jgi:hypothetical protein
VSRQNQLVIASTVQSLELCSYPLNVAVILTLLLRLFGTETMLAVLRLIPFVCRYVMLTDEARFIRPWWKKRKRKGIFFVQSHSRFTDRIRTFTSSAHLGTLDCTLRNHGFLFTIYFVPRTGITASTLRSMRDHGLKGLWLVNIARQYRSLTHLPLFSLVRMDNQL